MVYRVTKDILQAKVRIVNRQLGFDPDTLEYNTPGAIQLYSGSGHYSVHRVCNDSHGVDDLMNGGNARETSEFLSGMRAALEILKNSDSNPCPACGIGQDDFGNLVLKKSS